MQSFILMQNTYKRDEIFGAQFLEYALLILLGTLGIVTKFSF